MLNLVAIIPCRQLVDLNLYQLAPDKQSDYPTALVNPKCIVLLLLPLIKTTKLSSFEHGIN